MRLPFPFFTRTHEHERTQPGVIIDIHEDNIGANNNGDEHRSASVGKKGTSSDYFTGVLSMEL